MNLKLNIKKASFVALALVAALYAGLLCRVVVMRGAYEPSPSDCVLILGHSLESGDAPGDWLVARLEKGLELYHSGYAGHIIVSGGRGPADNVTVAASMQAWLIERGVSRENIIMEEQARNTCENMLYAADVLKSRRFESVIVVTNDFHIHRSMLMAARLLPGASGAPATVPFSFRKAAAYMKEPFSIVVAKWRNNK